MAFIRVTEYQDGTVHYLNPERIEQMQEVWGRQWKTAIAMIDPPPGGRWLRVRESVKDIQFQIDTTIDTTKVGIND